MNPIFQFDDVTKRYGKQVALDRVSLEGPSGTVVALLGENGAGKTTAIRILLGLTEAESGRSQAFGLNSKEHGQEIRRRVGYVSERPTLYEWMSVGEIGWFTAAFYPRGYQSKYNELVTAFELPAEKKVKSLSKGMQAKVTLALAMAHEPDLLILDEPTSGLDPMVRREFLESMVEVAATGRTVLLASHQIAEVERVADVVAILRKGRLRIVERLDDLKQDVRELTVTLNNGFTDLPDIPGQIISRQHQDRQYRLLVRGIADGQIESFRSSKTINQVEVRNPTLEEIFVGYMREEDAGELNSKPEELV